MAQPVHKIWQGRFTEAWHRLDDEERQRLMARVGEALESVGGKELVVCTAAWSDEQWPYFGLEQFPDLDAVLRHAQLLDELSWSRYMSSRTTLGTELVMP